MAITERSETRARRSALTRINFPGRGGNSGFHPLAEHSTTLPSYYYYEPAIFAREKEEIFFKTWQLAGYIADLQNVGDYVTFQLLDQLVFVVRDKNRSLRAFYNVCMHRGHTLLAGKGNVKNIRCPFHAWTYGLDGALKAAGNAENVHGFDLADFALTEVRVEQFLHMVFVNLDPAATPLAEQAGGLAAMMQRVLPNLDQMKRVRRDTYEIKANWKLLGDQLECYHCPVIHPQVMGGEDSYLQPSFDSEEHGIWSVDISRGTDDVLEKIRKFLPADVGTETFTKDVYIWFLWPNLILITHHGPPNLKIGYAIPNGVECVIRHMDHFVLNDPPTAFELAQMDNHMNVAAPQDREAMEKQMVGIKARGYRQGRLMVDAEHSWRSEHGVHFFDDLVWKALNGDAYEVG
jgi:choline monooxygenase